MYIKYLGNIYNLKRYSSISRGNSPSSINLHKENNSYVTLEFSARTREFIIESIWDEIKKGSKYFDLDEAIKIYTEADKYKMV